MRIYTRTGDDGSTALGDGQRVPKSAGRVAAYGDVDELNSILGVLAAEPLPESAAGNIARVQASLFEVGASLASRGRRALPEDVVRPAWVEAWVDDMELTLAPLRNFIVPGGHRTAALAQLARATCRRAERQVVALGEAEGGMEAVPFLNRLSDALFVLARWLNVQAGVPDVLWQGRR
ncbi:MAG: cob(I)yrinic acid a,c-diamide adenosyltransferase [Acidobacteriota bacterium]